MAAVVFVYSRVWRFGFVSYDDLHYLTMSPHVSNGLTLAGAKWALTTFYFVNWHPMTWLSYMLDVELYGWNAGGIHFTNTALHLATSILLFRLLKRLTDADLPSAFVAAMFAVHPLHVESVAWVSERKDVLSAFFLMLSFSAYAAYARRPGFRGYLVLVGLFILGLMSKPMLVTFPFLLLLFDVWPLRRWAPPGEVQGPGQLPAWRLFAEKVPLFLLSAASSFITLRAQEQNVAKLTVLPFSVRLANAADSYVRYAVKTLWPADLAVFYPYPRTQSGWWMLACLAGLTAVSLLVAREARRRPYLAVGWFWYIGTLVPVIGLVQAGDQAMADRYTYIPIVGLFIMAAWGGAELGARRAGLRFPLRAAAVGCILACMVISRAQAGYWRNDKELWARALAVTRDNYIAESGMGTVLLSEGKLKEAIAHYEKAVALEPLYAQTYNTLGVALMKYGHVREALPYLSQAVKLRPDFAEAHSNLGLALSSLGDVDQAIARYKEALRLKPDYAEVRGNLAIEFARQGRLDEALAQFSESLRLDPDSVQGHYNLAVLLFQKGMKAEALEHLRTVLRLRPGHADARRMHDELLSPAPRP